MDIGGAVVLVTGGSGLIGSHTVDRLLDESVSKVVVFDKHVVEENLDAALSSGRVEVIEADICDCAAVKAAAKGADFVIHLAAMLMRKSTQHLSESLRPNVLGTLNLLEALGETPPEKLLFASSISIYGSRKTEVRMSEDYPLNNRTIYGAAKIFGEQLCRVYHDQKDIKYLSLRISGAYGPRQHLEGVYPRLIMTALDRIDAGLPPQIEGDGSEIQDFIYVKDVARANIMALKSDRDDEAYNIASGHPTSARELMETLVEVTGCGLPIEFLPRVEQYTPSRWPVVDKARENLGFQATTDLRTGLRETIEWRARRQAKVAH